MLAEATTAQTRGRAAATSKQIIVIIIINISIHIVIIIISIIHSSSSSYYYPCERPPLVLLAATLRDREALPDSGRPLCRRESPSDADDLARSLGVSERSSLEPPSTGTLNRRTKACPPSTHTHTQQTAQRIPRRVRDLFSMPSSRFKQRVTFDHSHWPSASPQKVQV